MLTGSILYLSLMIVFPSEACFVVPVSGLYDLGVFLEMVAFSGNMGVTVTDPELSAAVH